ncbi:MAG: DUF1800 domain-containing protein [Chloroflexota bacterium]
MTQITRRDFLKLTSLTAAASALTACEAPFGGAPNQPPSVSPTAPPATYAPAEPILPVPPENLPDLSIIALNRLAFGPRPGDLEAFQSLGATDEERLAAYVEGQLYPESIDDSEWEARLASLGFETLHKSLEDLFREHIVENPYDDNDDRHWQWFVLPADETAEVTFLKAIYSRRQLQELLADFWHNHFNVYGWHEDATPLFASYDRDVIRAHLFGNFRQFLEAVAGHPSMLYYLDNRSNSDAGPNENFARELFELHTLGAESYLGVRDQASVEKDASGVAVGYVDNDVYEAARCFTGWRVDDDTGEWEDDVGMSGRFLYYKPWHDRFNKLILGQYLPADQEDMQDARDVLDLLAAHPGTARHIARKLVRRFVSDDAPESLVQAAADAFLAHKDSPDQLRQVYRVILLSPEFRQTWGGKIKRPFEFAAAMFRALNADFARVPGGIRWTYYMMGQGLFEHHPPDGYPDAATAWANSMAMLYGWNLTVGVVDNWWNDDEEGRRAVVDLRAQTPPALRTASSLTDFWIARLLGRALPEDSRQAIIKVMAGDYSLDDELSDDDINWRLSSTVALVLMTPEFRMR